MHEKKLNKVDLHSYKNLEGQIYGIVPGVHHIDTVTGTRPMAHKGAPEMNLEQPSAGSTSRIDFNNATVRD